MTSKLQGFAEDGDVEEAGPLSPMPAQQGPSVDEARKGADDVVRNQRADVTFESGLGVDLSEQLLRGLNGFGFETRSLVQARAIAPVASGADIVVHAQSGMRNTGAFAIDTLQRIDVDSDDVQVAVLAPTRELATKFMECTKL